MQNLLCESVNASTKSFFPPWTTISFLNKVGAWKPSTVTCSSCMALASVPADTKLPSSGRWALIPWLVSHLVQEGCWAAWWPLISSGAGVQCLGAGGIPALAHCLACLLSMTSSTMCWCKHELNCSTNIGTKCFKLWLFIWQNPQIQRCDIYCLAMVPQCKFLISHCQDSWCSHPLKADSTSSPYCSCTTKGESACTCGLTFQCQGKGRRM